MAALGGGDPLVYLAPPNPPGIGPSLDEALTQLAAGHLSLQKALWQAYLAQPWRREP